MANEEWELAYIGTVSKNCFTVRCKLVFQHA